MNAAADSSQAPGNVTNLHSIINLLYKTRSFGSVPNGSFLCVTMGSKPFLNGLLFYFFSLKILWILIHTHAIYQNIFKVLLTCMTFQQPIFNDSQGKNLIFLFYLLCTYCLFLSKTIWVVEMFVKIRNSFFYENMWWATHKSLI